MKNKTFFWFAGEKYVDNQPQQTTVLVPTAAELTGNFQGVTRNGAQVVIKDPLTGVPFPNNQIPASRLNSVGLKLASYLPPADTQVDNGNTNFGMTDLLPNKANQFTTKVDHHFNNAVALSGFFLRQETHEASTNYNPVNDFVGASYQLDRVIKTFVVNNTYILNSSTVLTLRGGYNKFDDNYNLNDRNGNPLSFNVSTLGWPSSLTSQMSDTQRFPTMAITGYKGSGWTNRQANGYYQYGANGTLSKLTGSHNVKMGGDYRIIGAQSLNYGASTGSFTFSGGFSGNALADLLLGYPQASSTGVPLNAQLDGFVRYYSGYAQDDWRVNDRLTLNYGIRLEHETGMMEKNNQQTINFDQTAINPLNSQVKLIDPVTGAQRQILGGLVFAGRQRRPTVQGNQPAIKPAPRVGMVFSFNEKTVLRGGWGLYFSPWNYPAAGTTGWGQIGYSATTLVPQATSSVPTVSMSNPFPNGLVQPSGSANGLLTGVGGDVYFVDPNKGAPRVQQVLVRPAARAARRRHRLPRVHRPDRQQLELGRFRQRAHQHQSARSEVSDARRRHDQVCAEPLLRRRGRRTLCHAGQSLDRPAAASVPGVRQRVHAAVHRRALAIQRGDLSGAQTCDRTLGRQLQLHAQPSERQPVRREQLLLERARPAEQLHRDSGIAVLQPGPGVRPQPARFAAQDRDGADAPGAAR